MIFNSIVFKVRGNYVSTGLKATLVALFYLPFFCSGQNPVVQTIYTADPAPLVYKDTVFLYTGHDEDKSTWFTMKDWHAYSSTDMVNWTDRGTPLSLKTFNWASKDAWAGQCTFRNGKFYFYVPVNQANGKGMAIGVAVSNSPTGPFIDALGKPLVHSGNGDIDPTVFIDSDGQAYLYWGNPYLKYVRLNDNMISYSGDVVTVPLDKKGFNVRYKDVEKRPSAYEEGPWMYKRGSMYYMVFAAGGVPEHLAYATSSSPVGPWQYRDTIMTVIKKGGAFTNHPGIINFKDHNYFFYHNGALPGGGGFTRSVCVEEFTFNADGTIPRINATKTGVVKSVGNINPFKRVEAETFAWEEGLETMLDTAGMHGIYLKDIDNGDYIKLRDVDFKKGGSKFEAHVAAINGGVIEIRVDSLGGILLGTCEVKNTGALQNWAAVTASINKVKGVRDVYLIFKGYNKELFYFDWWAIKK